MNRFKRILKIFIKSMIICFSMAFLLSIINLIMGIHIGVEYYFMMSSILTVCLTSGLVLLNSKKIFTSKPQVTKKIKGRPNKRKRVANQRIQKRKIS